jgi:hypothetical protein
MGWFDDPDNAPGKLTAMLSTDGSHVQKLSGSTNPARCCTLLLARPVVVAAASRSGGQCVGSRARLAACRIASAVCPADFAHWRLG